VTRDLFLLFFRLSVPNTKGKKQGKVMSIEARPFSEEEDAEHIEEDLFGWTNDSLELTYFLCKHAYY